MRYRARISYQMDGKELQVWRYPGAANENDARNEASAMAAGYPEGRVSEIESY